MSVHRGAGRIDAIEKAFRDVIQGQSTERTLAPDDQQWWIPDNNPTFAGYGLTIYHRQIEVKDGGVNEPGIYTQTAIVMAERVIQVTGKMVEVLNFAPTPAKTEVVGGDFLFTVQPGSPLIEQAKKDASKKQMHMAGQMAPLEDLNKHMDQIKGSVAKKKKKKKKK